VPNDDDDDDHPIATKLLTCVGEVSGVTDVNFDENPSITSRDASSKEHCLHVKYPHLRSDGSESQTTLNQCASSTRFEFSRKSLHFETRYTRKRPVV
jgi:hypothetical protein